MDITSFLLGYKSGTKKGGGSSADVRYVTFKSYDGSEEHGKKAVATGDNCADPIARGVFDRPTRESDAQYDYVHIGWSKNPDNVLDDTALDAVTEDRVLYAVYAATVRYYTITYYDSDGTTVLKSETLAYGSTPVGYTPEKDGYSFAGWTPDFAAVTGNASYTASWIEAVTFAGSSWAKIAEIAASGNAADYFAAGDERMIPVTIDGTTYSFKAKIVDFNHDELNKDGEWGHTNGISIMLFTVPNEKQQWRATSPPFGVKFNSTPLYTYVNNFYKYFPEELQAVIRFKKQKFNETNTTTVSYSSMRTWIPSSKEICPKAGTTLEVGTLYEYFNMYNYGAVSGKYDNYKRGAYTADGKLITSGSFWCCDGSTISYNYSPYAWNTSGTVSTATATNTYYVAIGFCIG